jgi:hypothetical protein
MTVLQFTEEPTLCRKVLAVVGFVQLQTVGEVSYKVVGERLHTWRYGDRWLPHSQSKLPAVIKGYSRCPVGLKYVISWLRCRILNHLH